MRTLALTTRSTYPEIIEFLEPAKNDAELKNLLAEVRRQGKRVFGSGFTISLDEANMSKGLNRVSLYVPGSGTQA